eukprot:3837964-Lingulodinium_polyedra.AAC.1
MYARALLPGPLRSPAAKVSEWETIAATELPTVGELIAARRLIYFARAVLKGGRQLAALVCLAADHPRSWAALLQGDFDWVRAHAPAQHFPAAGTIGAWA